ncbi:MAG: TatD family hydrolase [Caldisericia bacterium]
MQVYFCNGWYSSPRREGMVEEVKAKIIRMMDEKKVVALGEIGLDYYRNLSDPEDQKKCFRDQLKIAEEKDFPVVIHCREAWSRTVRILVG